MKCHPERSEGPVLAGCTSRQQRATLPHRSLATLGMTAVLTLISCKTAPQPQKPIPAAALADVAGESTDTAVTVPADAPKGGVDFENNWIFDRFGRFRRNAGGTGTLYGRRYDVVKIELPNGDKKTVYFDITENWKRWSPP